MLSLFRWMPVAVLVLMSVTLPLGQAFAVEDKTAAKEYKYICPCAMASGCNLAAEAPAKCPCGKDLLKKRVIAEDDQNYYVCTCDDQCDCGLSDNDAMLCSCEKRLHAIVKGDRVACNYATEEHCAKAGR